MTTPLAATLMETFSDPNTMQSLSFGEKMTASAMTMVLGLGITFLVLFIIWAFITIISRIMNAAEKKPAAAPAAPAAPAPAAAATKAAPAEAAAEAEESEDMGEIVAAIAAAIAAMEGTTADKLIVKRITRIAGTPNAWNTAGRQDIIMSRRI